MEEQFYAIEVDGRQIAEYVPLEYTILFTEAIFTKFYRMPGLKVDIERMNLNTEECNE